jgi:hypothetical protein
MEAKTPFPGTGKSLTCIVVFPFPTVPNPFPGTTGTTDTALQSGPDDRV